ECGPEAPLGPRLSGAVPFFPFAPLVGPRGTPSGKWPEAPGLHTSSRWQYRQGQKGGGSDRPPPGAAALRLGRFSFSLPVGQPARLQDTPGSAAAHEIFSALGPCKDTWLRGR